MTWDNSPWCVEGAQTSANVGRLVAWHATNGAIGVARPTDLRVRAKDVPGSSVLVSPGACTVPVNAVGRFLQTYVGSNPTDDEIAIPSTGSGSGRSDLIVARVENPLTGEPWSAPADPLTGQYIFTRRYPSVPASATHVNQVDPSASAITLARIDIPASTATITQSMITDLRGKATAGDPPLATTPMASANQDYFYSQAFDRTVVEDVFPYTQTAYAVWPDAAVWTVAVPSNATEAVIDVRVECEQRITSGQSSTNNAWGNTWGLARIRMLGVGVDTSVDVEFDRDYYGGTSPTTVTIPVGGTMAVPAAARGKTLTFQMEARMYSDANTKGRLVIASGSYIRAHFHFNVRPVAA